LVVLLGNSTPYHDYILVSGVVGLCVCNLTTNLRLAALYSNGKGTWYPF